MLRSGTDKEERLLLWLQGYFVLLAATVFTFSYKKFSTLSIPFELSLGNPKALGLFLISLILLFCLLVLLRPRNSIFRRLTFLALLLFETHFNRVGAETNLFQFWLWSCFILALIPSPVNGNRDKWRQEHLSLGIQYSISIILIFYFLSGFWKSMGAISQFLNGEPHLFSANGLVYHIYSEKLRAGAKPLLESYIVNYKQFNTFLSIAVVLLQLSTIVGVFRPAYHRILGVMLLLFHFGTALTLDITYPTNYFLVTWALVMSPFAIQGGDRSEGAPG